MSKTKTILQILNKDNNRIYFQRIRDMIFYELKAFIKSNRSIQKTIMKGKYSEEDRMLSSQVIYAKNRLRLMTH